VARSRQRYLRAALEWCQADPDGAEGEERLASALGRFWRDRGYTREAFEWLMHAAMRRPGAVSVGRGRALNWASVVAQSGDFAHERHVALLEESVGVLRQAGDPAELSLALRHLWWSRTYGPFGKPDPDVSVLEESVAIARAAGDRRDTGWGLLYLAQSAVTRGDMAEARSLTEEAVSVLRGLDPNSLLQSLCMLGVALAEGEYARAVIVFTEMVDESHESGECIWLSDAWFGLAGAIAAGGDIAAARACFRALVSELRAASFGHVLPRVLLALAMFEAGRGDQARAARLLGAFEAAGSSPNGWPLEGFCLGPGVATLRARFQQAPAAAALAADRRLMVDQALDEALAAST
jgi:hypothetical protein